MYESETSYGYVYENVCVNKFIIYLAFGYLYAHSVPTLIQFEPQCFNYRQICKPRFETLAALTDAKMPPFEAASLLACHELLLLILLVLPCITT